MSKRPFPWGRLLFLVAYAGTIAWLLRNTQTRREAALDQIAELEQLNLELQEQARAAAGTHEACELALRHDDQAFRDLLRSHQALQELHRASLVWGPMRAPRDCAREIVLMNEDAWPTDLEAELGFCIRSRDWCENERSRLITELDDLSYCWQRWPDGGAVPKEVHEHIEFFRWNNCGFDPHTDPSWIYPEVRP